MMNFDEINAILGAMVDSKMVEPIDDPSLQVDFWDWADVVGVVDQFCPSDDPFWGVAN